jgi:hypothetical protein
VTVPGDKCPRIQAEFLAEQERELGPLLYRQEYQCEFMDAAETIFATALVERRRGALDRRGGDAGLRLSGGGAISPGYPELSAAPPVGRPLFVDAVD